MELHPSISTLKQQAPDLTDKVSLCFLTFCCSIELISLAYSKNASYSESLKCLNIFVDFLVTSKMKGVDLDAPGNINGVPVMEVDSESFEEKPWRKPGVCICVVVQLSLCRS